MKKNITAYQLKITLQGTEPPVWRRIQVLSNMSLNNLSYALNLSMGWECCHLYLFEINGAPYGDSEHSMGEWYSDKTMRMRDLVEKKVKKFIYIYDFGDGWRHEVQIEKEVQAEREKKYPFCLEGENACPPEDCGGTGGFAELKEALADRKHPRHKELKEWCGPFHTSHFDSHMANFRMINSKIPKNFEIKRLEQKNNVVDFRAHKAT